MEFNFTWKRIAVFLGFLLLFGILGGFSNPALLPDGSFAGRLTRPWIYSVMLFVAGAVSATFVDHWTGLVDRTNIRVLYGVLGVLAMGSSLVWLHVLRSAAESS